MRLIDADALEKAGLIMVKLSDKEDKLLTKFEWKDVPTAYDVEEKVAELEAYRAKFDCSICKYGKTESQICTKDCMEALVAGLSEIVRGKE